MKPPELVDATREELDELLKLAKPTFPDTSYQRLENSNYR
jgi:hypothetical protein